MNLKEKWKYLVNWSNKQHLGEQIFKYRKTAVVGLSSNIYKNKWNK